VFTYSLIYMVAISTVEFVWCYYDYPTKVYQPNTRTVFTLVSSQCFGLTVSL